ncbi:MAG: Gfo/Idh/MocA family oxidoreductase [Kiritimatiellae bacterium]|nr:Gfo/Idh/MocA family oxidoreductase [Kiritimatiellia bacterium]
MKVAILGAGGMGEAVIGHLKQSPHVKSQVAFDVSDERIRKVRENHGVPGTTRLEDILSDREVKLVFVTAANHAHKELAIRSLEAGKAVMTEKPMANTLDDARAMVETAERLGAFFQVGFELRYSKLYTKIKEWVDAGLLGQVVSTHCLYCTSCYARDQWRNRKQEGGDTFGERLSHYVDLTRWWVGAPVAEVFSACPPIVVPYMEVRDNYHTTYRFANGAVSHITFYLNYGATFRGDPLADSITDLQLGDGHKLRYIVVGTKGAAETDVFYRRIKRWQFTDKPERMESDWVEKLTWTSKEDHFYYHNTTDQTLDIVRRVANGLPPMTPARDAYETMRLCFAAEQSAEIGRSVSL